MPDLSQLDDGTLRAYLDGELDANLSRQIETASKADEVLQTRLDAFRHLDALLDTALEPVRATPAPAPTPAHNTAWWGLAAAILLAVGLVAALARTGPDTPRLESAQANAGQVLIGERVVATPASPLDLRWRTEDSGATVVTQPAGSVFYRVEHGTPFTVETPLGSATVTGTCFTLEYSTMNEFTKKHGPGATVGVVAGAALMLTVHEGSVVLANDEGAVEVVAGAEAHVVGRGAPQRGRPEVLATTSSDHAELAKLRESEAAAKAEVARLEQALAEAQDDELTEAQWVRKCATSVGISECSVVEPSPAVLERRAECGTVGTDLPNFIRWDIGPKIPGQIDKTPRSLDPPEDLVELVGLTDREQAAFRRANEAFVADYLARLEALAKEFPDLQVPGDESDDPTARIAYLLETLHVASDSEDAIEVRRRIAEERAGWSSPPSLEGTSATERFLRLHTNVGDLYEDAVAEHLGAARARELRLAKDGWGSSRLWAASCPSDDESE